MKNMTLMDLTHPISEDMPVYPGTEPPVIVTGCTVAEDGFFEKKITMYSHTGTHVDAPAHLIKDGKTLDAFPVDQYVGSALVLDASEADSGIIGLDIIEPRLKDIERVDFLLIRTGWSRYWGTDRYFVDYPVLSIEAAEGLCGLGLKGIGFDAISPDPVYTTELPVHHVLMQAEMIIIENLTGLEHLPKDRFLFSCLPLAFTDADGSPVRAVAYVDQR
jgi:kynurenine formamidase